MFGKRTDKKVTMNHNLAKALIEAGIEHHDLGGIIGDIESPIAGLGTATLDPLGSSVQNISKSMTAQNGFQAQDPYTIQDQRAIQGREGQNYYDQQALARQLLAQSQGQGPNPAMKQLNQTTQANAEQAAGLAASNRGLNPALAARLGSEAEVNANQNAAGQAATMAAQQQLAAEGQLQQQQATMGNENTAQQNIENTALLGTEGLNQKTTQANTDSDNKAAGGLLNGAGAAMGLFAEGGKVPPHLEAVAKIFHSAKNYKTGGSVPGKAVVKGNSFKNDNEPALLSPGEIVLPRSVTQAKDAPAKAAEFVKHLQGKGSKKDKKSGYSDVAESKKSLADRVARLEKMIGGKK